MSAVDLVPHFEEFFRTFQDSSGNYKYKERLSMLSVRGSKSLLVDYEDFISFDPKIGNTIETSPDDTLSALNEAATRVLNTLDADYAKTIDGVVVRIVGRRPYRINLRSLSTSKLGRFVTIEGLLIRTSSLMPRLKKAAFRCEACGTYIVCPQVTFSVTQPDRCPNPACPAKRPKFMLDTSRSVFEDFQIGRVQENPEELPPGQLPRFVDIVLRDDLVDSARPGDRVVVSGVLRVKRSRKTSTLFDMYLDVNSIEALGKELEFEQLSKEDIKRIREIASRKDAFDLLVNSIASAIYGHRKIKEALLLALISGREKVLPDGTKLRGDIHVLLIGDPGTAKSELLKFVARVAPRGLYTSGRGTTAAGLTAAVVREAGGGLVLEAGAVVLADRGVCAVDEIDKMRPEDRVALHEMMEQQTVSVAKGGIVATLNARTTLIAAANPVLGRYDIYRNVADNVNLPVTLLSRFDLIFILRDEPRPDEDAALAYHILEVHSKAEETAAPIPADLLKKYIAYARSLKPTLSEEAKRVIKDYFLRLRATYTPETPIAISPRQLESLVRIAEARCKAELRERVTEEDAKYAIELLDYCMKQVGVDVATGRIDIDTLMGKPKSIRDKYSIVLEELSRLQKGRETVGVPEEELIETVVQKYNMERKEVENIINALIKSNVIYMPRSGMLSRVYG